MKNNLKIRVLFFSVLLFVIFCLLYLAIVPFGHIVYTQNFKNKNYFIQKLSPPDRVEILSDSVRIKGDPVYFSLRTPRTFNEAKLSYKFRTNIKDTIIETGPLVNKTIWQYQLKPISNAIINDLVEGGKTIYSDEILFWQKNKSYSTFEDFLLNPPELDRVAFYYYDWQNNFVLPNYATATEEQIISYPLQGAYKIYTYVKNEALNFSFQFSDLNQNQDKDKIELFLFYDGVILDSRSLDDERDEEKAEVEDRGKLEFTLPDLPEGLYKIELRANNDIVTREIKTSQKKLSFVNKIGLLRDSGADIKLYTDSKEIQATTIHPDRLQTIKIASTTFEIKETYRQHQFDVEEYGANESVSQLILEKDGVMISGNGVWSFNKDAMVNPAQKKVDKNFDLDSTEYVVARYKVPIEMGDWQNASQNFDLSQAYRESGAYQFIISIPGLRADDNIDDWVEIDEIRVELSGKSLWGKFLNL